ncbi:hypothetical protein [Aestuariivirga sp.]|uniref:hypothetical protein n=1 Tax=Aestuariivirga sp. TaxID=2650926 RepID=UPI0035B229BA
MPQGKMNDSLLLRVALVVTSALLWSSVWLANKYLMAGTNVAPGIDLVFLPAGFRLLLVIVFGVWGALGVFLADPLMFMLEFQQGSFGEVLVNAAISGFAPYLTVRAFYRLVGIQGSLIQFKPIHLPLLALAVSVVTPLLLNLHFLLQGRERLGEFLHNFTAMMTGDFLGCLLVSVLARVALAAGRALFQRPR